MKDEILASLDEILNSTTSIKLHVDRVYELRVALDEYLTDEERIHLSGLIKSKVQKEAEEAYAKTNGWGAAYMATGSGKSKIAIDVANTTIKYGTPGKVLLSVPTEKLRDENWKEEFTKWNMATTYEKLEKTCYASLNKYKGEHFSLVILDEGHNITENNSEFFQNNTVDRCLLLTATKPRDTIKLQILKELKINPFFELALDEAVKLGLVAPYEITVINMKLNSTDKYIKKTYMDKRTKQPKTFYQTEFGMYGYLTTRLKGMPSQMGFINRMRFIYDLKSKTQVALNILTHIIPQDLRTLIFCGSKNQAIQLCERRFFSKPTLTKFKGKPTEAALAKQAEKEKEYRYILSHWEGDAGLNDFKDEKINRLSCVAALNEGHNISNMDVGFVVQLNSNELNLIQRVGRLIRYRPGHIGKIIILCVEDSIDKTWVEKATASLNVANIEIIELSELRTGIKKITF